MVKILVSTVIAFVLAPVASFFSGWIVMGHDGSQADTVGDITRNGFPIWYRESAPGFSVVDGLHVDRLGFNTAFWFVVLTAAMFAIYRYFQRRSRKTSVPH